ncbi:coiled-coil and C2 domain-containing protein 1 [Mytilus galloprovincialis]|uniref:Coiled-coil and C2 domain-containing protein 1 n=1 Tax=Mytilus galloprovincialis TaxID=29158 RepID=A0A8B6CX24_MYTGA|nr:coiled-coil and C2 domain-containing protein 1 [Mytilus galloprovincialis]
MVSSLYSLAIHKVGQYVGCASLETVNPPFDEQTLKLLASEAFPKDEEHVKLLTDLVSNGKPSTSISSEWHKGESFYQKGHVQNIRQVGFMIGASVKSSYDQHHAIAKVVLTFERHRITSTKCSICKDMIWCSHVVAVILKRIRSPDKVPVHAPLTDTLLTLTREQLQKLLQYAINQSPGDILCQIFEHIDKIKNPRSLISRIQGYPDPTLGIGEDEQNTDQLLLKKIRKNLDHDLLYTDDFESKLQNNSLSDQVQFMASDNLALKEKNLKTAISLLRIKDVDMAGRILIQIAQALFEGPRLAPSSMLYRLDVERWFSLFVSSFKGQIRHDILTVALDMNKRSCNADGSVSKKFIFEDRQTTMRSVSLKTAGNFNSRDYLGENKNAPFYEPVLACLLENTPENLENLYCQKVPLSQRGFLKSDKLLGTVNVKLHGLDSECTLHDSHDLTEGRKQVGGKLEVKLRIRDPFKGKQVEVTKEKWLVIDQFIRALGPKETKKGMAPAKQAVSKSKSSGTMCLEVLKYEKQLLDNQIASLKSQLTKEQYQTLTHKSQLLQQKTEEQQGKLKSGGKEGLKDYVKSIEAEIPQYEEEARYFAKGGDMHKAQVMLTKKKHVEKELAAIRNKYPDV